MNDDLISRQELCEYALNQKDKSVTPNDIMRFPSAQPEADEVARDMAKIIENEKAMRIIQKTAKQQWIPCSKKLPESSDNVLCCDVYGEYLIGHPYEDDKSDTGYSADDYEGCKMGGCVAWMLLPEPWKGE